jgi:hypothetical protein
VVRIPSGYIFLACAGVLLAVVIAYAFGYATAQRQHQQAIDEEIRDSVARLGLGTDAPEDPLATGERQFTPVSPGGATEDQTQPDPRNNGEISPISPADGAAPTPTIDRPAADNPREDWGPIESDPRIQGHQYRVVATTRREGALRLAEFLRGRGLEAYVIGDDNPLLRVIVLPGFRDPRSSDPAVVRLIESIERAGEAWKALHSGESDLKDSYWSLY